MFNLHPVGLLFYVRDFCDPDTQGFTLSYFIQKQLVNYPEAGLEQLRKTIYNKADIMTMYVPDITNKMGLRFVKQYSAGNRTIRI